MSKTLTRLALALLVASVCARVAAAQETAAPSPSTAAPEWVAVSPEGEGFAALMPKEPLRLEQSVRAGEFEAEGQRYTATAAGGARYVVWSLTDAKNTGERLKDVSYEGWRGAGLARHLDLVAEAAWEFLIRPEVERLEVETQRTGVRSRFIPNLTFVRFSELNGRASREYELRLENEGGPVYVCADGRRLYIVAALSPDPKAADSRRFVESFAVGTKTPNRPAPPRDAATPLTGGPGLGYNVGGGGPGPGPNAPVDYNRPFRPNEVTKKASITFKPEPGFTESARKFNVTGVVRLRAVLSKTGEMQSIAVVKSLPHGLTEKAIAAARAIRFEPAQKDGQPVSQYVVLEYNYNIY